MERSGHILSGTGILDVAFTSKVIMVVGDVDTGKTTFVRDLANRIVSKGRDCAVIDADIGQSDIGPPGTIGLGRLAAPVRELSDLKPIALSFVGSFSPPGRMAELLVGTSKMLAKAKELGCEHIVIDTTGLVNGPLGRRLKIQKTRLLQPDLVICLQRRDECRFMFHALSAEGPARILSIGVPEGIRSKSPAARRENRVRALRRHLAGSSLRILSIEGLRLPSWPLFWGDPLAPRERQRLEGLLKDYVLWAESSPKEMAVVLADPPLEDSTGLLRQAYSLDKIWIYGLDDFEGRMVGLYSREMEFVHLAVLKEVDFSEGLLYILCPMEADQIGAIEFGEAKIDFSL